MYTAEDYYLFFAALILFFGFLSALGAVIDWYSDWRDNKRWLAENQRKCQLPRRQSKNYVQEWDDILEKINRRNV